MSPTSKIAEPMSTIEVTHGEYHHGGFIENGQRVADSVVRKGERVIVARKEAERIAAIGTAKIVD